MLEATLAAPLSRSHYATIERPKTAHLLWYVLLAVLLVIVLLAEVMISAVHFPLSLTALLLNENYAQSLGLNVTRVKRWSFIATGLLVGVVTAYCGPIAFLGIVAAHLGR
jgi:iron complex transport system permease protein